MTTWGLITFMVSGAGVCSSPSVDSNVVWYSKEAGKNADRYLINDVLKMAKLLREKVRNVHVSLTS